MKAEEFDEKFDRGDDVASVLDIAKAQRPSEEQRRVEDERAPSPSTDVPTTGSWGA